MIGGDFYSGDSYPTAYHGTYFFADWGENWIHAMRVSLQEEHVNSFSFATSIPEMADIVADPVSGDLHIVQRVPGTVYRVRYDGPATGDLDGSGVVNVWDLLTLLGAWGECSQALGPCAADINGDGTVNVFDLLLLIGHWGPT